MRPYLELLKRVLHDGHKSGDRTGTGTLSLFGTQTRYNVRDSFPLVTTKRVNFSAVVKELLWFLRGETNIQTLGCGIWDAWADEQGELGPIYGRQWRDFGGVDQIAWVVAELRRKPDSRRLLVSAWNPADLPEMALPPCHTMWQLRLTLDGLSLHLYQRSADLALGVPFNIASYALLLMMVAKATGHEAYELVHTIGDAHIYLNHIEGIEKQLSREPRERPRVTINGMPDFSHPEAMTLTPEDFVLEGYNPHPAIKFPVAV